MSATAETTAATGIQTWELYNATATPDAKSAYEIVARDATGTRVKAIRFQTISQKVVKHAKPADLAPEGAAFALVDKQGNILGNTLKQETAAVFAHLGHDRLALAQKQQYGCFGDILWAAGGFIGAIGTCGAVVPGIVTGPADGFLVAACAGAIIAGPVAGVVSAMEDCSPTPQPPPPDTTTPPDDGEEWDEYDTDIMFWDDGGWSDWGY